MIVWDTKKSPLNFRPIRRIGLEKEGRDKREFYCTCIVLRKSCMHCVVVLKVMIFLILELSGVQNRSQYDMSKSNDDSSRWASIRWI